MSQERDGRRNGIGEFEPLSTRPRWEYLLLDLTDAWLVKANALGEEGWEMVGTMATGVVFKRGMCPWDDDRCVICGRAWPCPDAERAHR
jgi:hypothetical protein